MRQKSVLVRHGVLEPEFKRDVRYAIAVVIHVNVVDNIWIEAPEAGTARRSLHRNVIRDDRYRVGTVGAHKGVNVGVIREWILADQRRFAMARRRDRGELKNKRSAHQ